MSSDLLPVMTEPQVSRRALLWGAGATVAATGLGFAAPEASAATPIRSQLDKQIRAICRGYSVGVSVQDMHNLAVYNYNSNWRNNCASIVKPFAVLMAIRAAKKKGRWLTSYERSMAAKAIIYSDNDACTYLWNKGGKHAGLDSLAKALKLRNTRAWYGWGWGRTWTSAGDYRYFLKKMLRGTGVVSERDRDFLLGLMGRVTASQTWGVGVVRSSSVKVEMKDGWVVLSNDNLWRVNSVGHVKGKGRDYVLTVLTGKNRTMSAGVRRCNDVSRAVYATLGKGELEETPT